MEDVPADGPRVCSNIRGSESWIFLRRLQTHHWRVVGDYVSSASGAHQRDGKAQKTIQPAKMMNISYHKYSQTCKCYRRTSCTTICLSIYWTIQEYSPSSMSLIFSNTLFSSEQLAYCPYNSQLFLSYLSTTTSEMVSLSCASQFYWLDASQIMQMSLKTVLRALRPNSTNSWHPPSINNPTQARLQQQAYPSNLFDKASSLELSLAVTIRYIARKVKLQSQKVNLCRTLLNFLRVIDLQVRELLPSARLQTRRKDSTTKVVAKKGTWVVRIPRVTDMHMLRKYWERVSISEALRIAFLVLRLLREMQKKGKRMTRPRRRQQTSMVIFSEKLDSRWRKIRLKLGSSSPVMQLIKRAATFSILLMLMSSDQCLQCYLQSSFLTLYSNILYANSIGEMPPALPFLRPPFIDLPPFIELSSFIELST